MTNRKVNHGRKGRLIIMSIAAILSCVSTGLGAELLVPGQYATIQSAINAAANGDTVIVSPGTYVENINFGGKNIFLTSTNPEDPDIVAGTVINGGGLGSVVTFDGSETAECTLTGFTITNGTGTIPEGTIYPMYGGGIYGKNTFATISNCVITGNAAAYCGGGMDSCDGTITNCTITGNSSSFGGGLYNCDGSIESCNITGNSVYYYYGGGLYDCDGSITNCTIAGNSANFGGGLYNCDGSIESCNITGNSAGSGGGLHSCSGLITNCTIAGNSASNGGGLYRCDGSITNCTITSNTGINGGGLLFCSGLITNCTITGNSANYGGGLNYCNGSIESCNITGNSANYFGGGLYDCDGTITNCTITSNTGINGGGLDGCDGPIVNCIITGNKAPLGSQLYGGSVPSYCCIEDWTGGGEGNINEDPMFVNAGEGNYHLTAGSPCIDTGNPAFVPEPEETDIDGDQRLIDGNRDGIARVDMGADEFVPNVAPVAEAGQDQTVYACVDELTLVTLDGSGSYDENGDELSYSWLLDGQEIATGINPVIELEVGEYVIQLIVNDGYEDSEPDEVIITVVEPLVVELLVLPETINMYNEAKYVMAVLRLPEGIGVEDVSDERIAIVQPGRVEAVYQKVALNNDGTVNIFGLFDKSAVVEIIEGVGEVDLTIAGKLVSGRCVYGVDGVKVVEPKWNRWRYRERKGSGEPARRGK